MNLWNLKNILEAFFFFFFFGMKKISIFFVFSRFKDIAHFVSDPPKLHISHPNLIENQEKWVDSYNVFHPWGLPNIIEYVIL